MEFRNLYSFLRVAEIGNFTRAAEEMGYAQSTVTTQIQQLETELGVPLFERIGKQNLLTVHGQQLIGYANQVMRSMEQMKNLGKSDSTSIQGTLRIGIMESLLSSVLLSVIGAFRERFPMVSVQVRLGVTAELIALLRHNEVDMIFTMGEHWDARDCECASSHAACAVFVSAKDHPLAWEKSLSLEAVLNAPLVLTGDKTYLYQELSKYAFRCGKSLNTCIQTDSARTVIDMVSQNLGISLLPEYMVRCEEIAKNYDLKILPVNNFSITFHIRIFYHKNKWLTPQMLGLINLIEDYWARHDKAY